MFPHPVRHDTFNRTVVELKHLYLPNNIPQVCTFNRTVVELKHHVCGWVDTFDNTFNRTVVELKPLLNQSYFPPYLPFNRTVVELKPSVARLCAFSC